MRSCSWDTIKTLRASRIQSNIQTNTIKLCVRTYQSNSAMVSSIYRRTWLKCSRVYTASERACTEKIRQNWFKLQESAGFLVIVGLGKSFCAIRAWRIHIFVFCTLCTYIALIENQARGISWHGVMTSKVYYGAAMDISVNIAEHCSIY